MVLTAIAFLVLLSILVLIHECGHFFAAKKLGIRVEEFGFGLPPRVFGKKIGETIYSINALPIGGFVRLYGEEGESEEEARHASAELKKRAFYARPIWQRAVVIVAGVFMNAVLAIAVISFLFTQGVFVPVDRVHVEEVLPETPAATAGLAVGDIIRTLAIPADATFSPLPIKKGEDLIKTVREHLGAEILLTIERAVEGENKTYEITIIPRTDYPEDQGPLGVVISNYEERRYPLWQAPFVGTVEAIKRSGELAYGIGITLQKLLTFQSVSKDVAGPLGIAQLTGKAVRFGNFATLDLLAILSLNLAIVNILPFPALDGGRLLFLIIEAIRGKRVHAHYERYIHQIGMMILLFLIILVTINDILRILQP